MIDVPAVDKRGPPYPENTEGVKATSNSAVDPFIKGSSVLLPSEIFH